MLIETKWSSCCTGTAVVQMQALSNFRIDISVSCQSCEAWDGSGLHLRSPVKWHFSPYSGNEVKIDVCHSNLRPLKSASQPCDNLAPRRHDPWITKTGPLRVVRANLSCCDHVGLTFYCTSAKQHIPVCLAGWYSKGRRKGNNLAVLPLQCKTNFRESQLLSRSERCPGLSIEHVPLELDVIANQRTS